MIAVATAGEFRVVGSGMGQCVFLGLGAAADRSIRTPASKSRTSVVEPVHQTEEYTQVRIPAQQAIDQSPAAMDDLTG